MTRGKASPGLLALLAMMLCGHVLAWWLRPFAFLTDIDSQHYARIAAEMLSGRFTLANHTFNDRFGVTVPTAAVYAVLGIGKRTSTLWPLIASLLTIGVVFVTTHRTFGKKAALLASLLLATNVVQIDYAAHLVPDIILSGLMLGSASLLQVARDPRGAARRPWLHGSLCALALFAGLLTKKTVLWATPFFLGLLIWDLARRRNVRLWVAFVTTSAAGLVLYVLFYYLTTGNPLHPIDNVEGMHNVNRASFADRSNAQVLQRLTLAPIKFFLRQAGYWHMVLLAVPALIHFVRPLRAFPPGLRFWSAYVVAILLYFWFGTTSLHSYNPLPISPRFLIPLLPPLSILGGVTLAGFLTGREREQSARTVLLLATAVFAGAALVTAPPFAKAWDPSRLTIYGAVALTLALLASPARLYLSGRLAKVAWFALVAALSLGLLVHQGIRSAVKPSNPLRDLENEFVAQHLAHLPEGTMVFTDEHSAFVLPILLERCGADRVRVSDWNDRDAVRAHGLAPAAVFVHQGTLTILNKWLGRKAPGFASEPPPHWRQNANREVPSFIMRAMSMPVEGQRMLLFQVDDPSELLNE